MVEMNNDNTRNNNKINKIQTKTDNKGIQKRNKAIKKILLCNYYIHQVQKIIRYSNDTGIEGKNTFTPITQFRFILVCVKFIFYYVLWAFK